MIMSLLLCNFVMCNVCVHSLQLVMLLFFFISLPFMVNKRFSIQEIQGREIQRKNRLTQTNSICRTLSLESDSQHRPISSSLSVVGRMLDPSSELPPVPSFDSSVLITDFEEACRRHAVSPAVH